MKESRFGDRESRKNVLERSLLATLGVLLVIAALGGTKIPGQPQKSDPLPSWNDGRVKQSIVAFVETVTTNGNADYVPEPERIAVFDNDGTLWSEKPIPSELYFISARVREMAEKDPSLRQQPSFKAALDRDIPYLQQQAEKAIPELLTAAYSNMTQEQFAAEVRHFIDTEKHPQLKVPYTSLAYPPMLELLAYLRANAFQIWICSGGTADFMRAFVPRLYGVPPERIIGSELKRESREQNGKRVIWRLPQFESLNDKDAKPVNIDRQIGMRPIFVAGNVGGFGDIAMMQYSKGRTGASFQLLINHDDPKREFLYGEPGNGSLDAAKKCGFTVVNIKSEWKTVLSFPKPQF